MTRVADIDLYYERRGDGPPVLFVSGTGGDLRARPSVFEGPLPRAFDVLAHDQRGLGRSSKPPGPYTMAGYADDAVALLDVVGWERCHVVGVSFGGMVAQELALRHPSRVDRLGLACTSSGGAGGASYPLHELDGMGREERARHLIGVGDVRLDAAWQAATQERTAALVAMALERAGIGADEPDQDEGARLQLEARRGHDTWDRLGQLRCPT